MSTIKTYDSMIFVWILNRAGMKNNEIADRAAKNALTLSKIRRPSLLEVFKNIFTNTRS